MWNGKQMLFSLFVFQTVILKRHDFVLLSKHQLSVTLNIQGNYSCMKFFFAASFFFLLFLLFVRWFLGLDDKAELMHRSDTVQCIIPLFYTVSIVIFWGVIPPDELSSFQLFLVLLSVYHEIVYPILDDWTNQEYDIKINVKYKMIIYIVVL